MPTPASPHARFRQALAVGNAPAALAAAADMPALGLTDALELCLVLRRGNGARFERALLRFHARLCREVPLSYDEAQAALALLGALRGPRAAQAARALAELFDRRSLEQASGVLLRWAEKAG